MKFLLEPASSVAALIWEVEMSAGYVYVLINASMPDLVKVGRTDRDPNTRVAELSGATGVPTPFRLVYSSYFTDCSEAEVFVHAMLERNGHRVAKNREFFSAPVQEAIDAVMAAKQSLGKSDLPLCNDNSERDSICLADIVSMAESVVGTETARQLKATFARMQQEGEQRKLLDQADEYFSGTGETLQDYEKAFTLYKEAAELGSNLALATLGLMYRFGKGCVKSVKKAVESYEKAAEKGYH